MLSRLAKSLAVKASASRTAQPLAKYLEEQISTFWHKPRVLVPRPAVAKPRTRCNEAVNSTCSHCKSNRKFECAFREPKTIDGWLCLTLTIGGSLLVVNTFGGKYRLLKKAKHEWDTKSEYKKRILTTKIKGSSLCLSGAQDHERVDGVDSKILSLGKWAWIVQRATEMEQESKGRMKMIESRCG
jgi:hypothetical protein